MASNETEVEVAPIYDSTLELPEGVSPLRLRADYATSLMASVFYGASPSRLECQPLD
jgi:hypothetical protein